MNKIKNFMSIDDILKMPETETTAFNKIEIENTLEQMFKFMYDYSNDESLDIDQFKNYLEWSNQRFIHLLTIRKEGYDYEADFGSLGKNFNAITDLAVNALFDPKTNDFVPFEKSDEIREIYNEWKSELYKSVALFLAVKYLDEQSSNDYLI